MTYQYDPYEWDIAGVEDMCEKENFGQRDYDQIYFDENCSEALDPELVRQGEAEEMDRFKKQGVYVYRSREQAANDKEGKFVKVKWVRINKGTSEQQRIRCRLVAQELGFGVKDDELYAGTPSLATMKMMLSFFASSPDPDVVLKVIDVKSAFLYGEARRSIYIELPSQDPYSGGEWVGLLVKAMYGTRDAPLIWRATVDQFMKSRGFLTNSIQPGVYYHPIKKLRVMIHVDDFMVIGSTSETQWFEDQIKDVYEITCTTLGQKFSNEVKYLNRTIRLTSAGLEVESDPKHVKVLMSEWGMQDCKGVETPLAREEEDVMEETEFLIEKEATRFRRAAARINYVAQDRPDLSTASRKLSQGMSAPREGHEKMLKRVLRYLKSYPRCISLMPWQTLPTCITLLVDSDWAGCKATRKSSSGGCVMMGKHLIGHWSKMQATVALSSGEAELNAAVKGVSEIIGFKNVCDELGWPLKIEIGTDATVCKSILLRQGCGKIKHLSTRQLWIQGAIETYGMKIQKIPRTINNADLMTHPCTTEDHKEHLRRMSQIRK